MAPVRADEAIPERSPWGSPRSVLTRLGCILLGWAAVFVATEVLHLPLGALVAGGLAILVAAVVFAFVRWRRRRRR